MAGKRLGKEDERHLWPEMLRAIREIQPRWVVGENVSGLINWNGGMVFDEVQAELEVAGYSVIPFILPACGVNAPHRRDRVWFVAYRCGEPIEQNIERGRGKRRGEWAEVGQVNTTNGEQQSTPNTGLLRPEIGQLDTMGIDELCKESTTPHTNDSGTGIGVRNDGNGQTKDEGRGEFTLDELRKVGGDVADTDRSRRGKDTMQSELRAGVTFKSPINSGTTNETENEKRQIGRGRTNRIIGAWDNFPTQPPIRGRNDGFSSCLVGITVPKHRNESIKGYGNAVVPQVVYQIFKAIQQYEDSLNQNL